MQGDSVESPKNSGLWIPDHSWRFTVDQDPVSSKQGASAGQEQLRGSHAASLQGQNTRDSFVFVGAENPLSLDTEAAFCKLILWTTGLPGKYPQQLGLELLVCKEDAAQNSALLSSVLCTQRHFCLLLLPMVAFQTIPWPVMMQFLMKFIFLKTPLIGCYNHWKCFYTHVFSFHVPLK